MLGAALPSAFGRRFTVTALAEAKRRTRDNGRVIFRRAILPDEMPRGPFDLITASEIAYYIDQHALSQLLHKLKMALSPNGRIVFLNYTCQFDDAAQLPALAHRRMRRTLEKSMYIVFHERHSRFDVMAFQKRRSCSGHPRLGSSLHSGIRMDRL